MIIRNQQSLFTKSASYAGGGSLFGELADFADCTLFGRVNLGQQNRLAFHPLWPGGVFGEEPWPTFREVASPVSFRLEMLPAVVATLTSSMAGLDENLFCESRMEMS